MSLDTALLEHLPEPVLVVTPRGETRFGNQAFQKLAAALGAGPQFSALFGPPAQVLLAEARRTGSAHAFLPVIAGGDASRGFRVAVAAHAGGEAFVVQLTDLSDEVEWRHQLYTRNSELAVLNDVGAAMSTTLDLDALARRIWEQTGRLMNNANFYLALHDPEPDVIRFPIWVEDGEVSERDRTRPRGHGLTEHVLESRLPLLLNGDVAGGLAALGVALIGRPCRSFLGTPLLFDGQAVGVIALQDWEQADRFGRHELDLISIVATQAAAAVRNARLYQDARSAYEQLSATQQRLLESERVRGVTETVGAMNHEVNNPLATIVGTAQLLLRRTDLEPGTRERVERMLEAAKRIQNVTSKMTTLIQATSRPYPGQMQILDVLRSFAGEGEPAAGLPLTPPPPVGGTAAA